MRIVHVDAPIPSSGTRTIFQSLAVGVQTVGKRSKSFRGPIWAQTTPRRSKLCDAWQCFSHGGVQSIRKGSKAIALDPDWTPEVQKGPNCPQLVLSKVFFWSFSAPNFHACSRFFQLQNHRMQLGVSRLNDESWKFNCPKV